MREALVNGVDRVVVPDHVAEWDAISDWERTRFASMREHLREGMHLWDVGAEHGWQSALHARIVGGDRMILVEPTPEFWPNIRLTFEGNGLGLPYATVPGLLGSSHVRGEAIIGGWPESAEGDEVGPGGYRYIHEAKHRDEAKVITSLDWMVGAQGLPCDAVTIDVEGAELVVLSGARSVLTATRPLVWVSVHPDLMARDYLDNPHNLRAFMHAYGYDGTLLGIDHEEHWFFQPR